jgi:hypothetical protein
MGDAAVQATRDKKEEKKKKRGANEHREREAGNKAQRS